MPDIYRPLLLGTLMVFVPVAGIALGWACRMALTATAWREAGEPDRGDFASARARTALRVGLAALVPSIVMILAPQLMRLLACVQDGSPMVRTVFAAGGLTAVVLVLFVLLASSPSRPR